ncbi:putative receptor-like protein kinase At4g00960 [Solanum tuberosum]|uniref:putative receptor-like protein kinase At4g00960 n=1 Tax=Solanum tuberosum TaxID=4113 RepID=UPI0003D28E0A|nr:PREDICTED: putative receptor-like protein kinase At4g00960 [Solanum tuberosum]
MASYVWWWRRLMVVIIGSVLMQNPVFSQPQTNLLGRGCSQYNATNLPDFFRRLNASFVDLRNQLSNQDKRFATTQQAVYAMIECRKYLSRADCVSCYDSAVSLIRTCSGANGARVTYDGCFLRYESNNFYQDTTQPGNAEICGNRTSSQPNALSPVALQLLNDLSTATPRISDFFAATKREASGVTVYGVAQCAESITESGCQDCLTVAYKNIEGCLPRYAEGRAVDAACFMRFSDRAFFADNTTTDITPFLGGGGSSNKKKAAIIGGVAGGVGLLLIILAVFLWYRLSRKPKTAERGNILGATELRGPVSYSFKDLKIATKDFNESNKLGEGGFGDVYKGTLKNGNVVAVKKLAIMSSRAKADFETEVRLISNVHHRNLIRLLGCSNKASDLLLVYEYMANGSLERYLYGDRRGMLNWKQRFNIIFGTARGLAYLHEQFHVCIIHRDIKSSNILLDDEFQPKIADFGLVRLLPEDQSHVSTKFAGTLGYTAPEYAIHGHLTEKVDVYSFGVVVLEIISGRRSNDMQIEPVTEYLLEQAWKLHETGTPVKLVDETLDPNEYNEQEVKKIIEIALMCTQSPANLRPSMSEVVVMLLSDRSTESRTPSRPTIISMDKSKAFDASMTTGSSASTATNTFSDFTGR